MDKGFKGHPNMPNKISMFSGRALFYGCLCPLLRVRTPTSRIEFIEPNLITKYLFSMTYKEIVLLRQTHNSSRISDSYYLFKS